MPTGVTLSAMSERPEGKVEQPEQKLGSGVDRSQIRRLLDLTPDERLQLFVASARNVAQLVASARPV